MLECSQIRNTFNLLRQGYVNGLTGKEQLFDAIYMAIIQGNKNAAWHAFEDAIHLTEEETLKKLIDFSTKNRD